MTDPFDDPFKWDALGHHGIHHMRTRTSKPEIRNTRTTTTLSGQTWTYDYPANFGETSQVIDERNQYWQVRNYLRRSDIAPITRRRLQSLDTGGAFFLRRLKILDGPAPTAFNNRNASGSQQTTFGGYRWPCQYAYNFCTPAVWDATYSGINSNIMAELFMYGGAGIAGTLPTVPESSVWRTFGELARDFPKVPGLSLKRRATLGGAADEFLNYSFGLAPTVSDLYGLGQSHLNAEELIQQFRRDANRIVRRGMTLLDEEKTTTSTHRAPLHPYGYPRLDPGSATSDCAHKVHETKRVWFSGAYQYRMPPESSLQKLQEFNRVYGTTPSAEDAWNLLPWSWLSDWFATHGNVIRNTSALSRNDLRIHHAYVMMERRRVHTYTNRGITFSAEEIVKSRVRASPFGFGFRPSDLSNKQKAILSALGISRWL